MRTTDYPVRATSERNDFNREDSKSSNEAYKSFTRDRRARSGGEGREALYSTTSRKNQQGGDDVHENRRTTVDQNEGKQRHKRHRTGINIQIFPNQPRSDEGYVQQ